MGNNDKKKKHTLSDRIKVYKRRFAKLDKKSKMQIYVIAALLVIIMLVAIVALFGKGKNPVSSSDSYDGSMEIDGSFATAIDREYDDKYTKEIEKYSDVVLPYNTSDDRNYFRETLFIGDSNTEGLSAYNHLSLQYVMGVTGMPIQAVTTNKCIWFVGYDEPVTIPTAVGMLKPRRIIINFGTNNAGGTKTSDFISYYEKALAAIEKAYPYADIIVESVLPVAKVRDYPSITMQDIDEYNLALAEMCREKGYKFLNTAEVFKDSKTGFMKSEYISKDGIHLTSDGYKVLLEYVGNHRYVTTDTRPARGNIPTRRNAPYTDNSSGSSSSFSSSMFSSSIYSSSIYSSSLPSSSSQIMSSSQATSSSRHESSSASSEDIQPSPIPSPSVSSSETVSSTTPTEPDSQPEPAPSEPPISAEPTPEPSSSVGGDDTPVGGDPLPSDSE